MAPWGSAPDSTRSVRRARLPRQINHMTGVAARAVSRPPIHQGNRRRSDQVNRVLCLASSLGRSLKVPVPLTTPSWSTDIARGGSQRVTSIESTRAKGPTRVRHSKVVPLPVRRCDVNVMEAASAIQRTCEEMSSSAAHTWAGGALIVRETLIRATGSRYLEPQRSTAIPIGLVALPPVGKCVRMPTSDWTEAREVPPGDILTDTTPHPVAGMPGRYRADIPEAWRVMYAFGGTTMATAIRAAVHHLGRGDLDLVGAEATYCAAIPCGPLGLQVEILRNGRNGAQVLVRAWALEPSRGGIDAVGNDALGNDAAGNDLVVAVVFGRRRESELSFPGSVAPPVPGPSECPLRETTDDSPFSRIPYHHQTDFRIAMGNARWGQETEPGDPEAASWFRFLRSPVTDAGRWEPAVLAVPGDVLGPAVHAGIGSRGGFFIVISLQIGLKFVADVRTEWVLAHSRAQSASHGFASGTAELYDEERRLVAVATQTALLRSVEGDPGATDA